MTAILRQVFDKYPVNAVGVPSKHYKAQFMSSHYRVWLRNTASLRDYLRLGAIPFSNSSEFVSHRVFLKQMSTSVFINRKVCQRILRFCLSEVVKIKR